MGAGYRAATDRGFLKGVAMEITRIPMDPQAHGLERVADIYMSKGFDVRSTAKPSPELVSTVTSAAVPKHIRDLFQAILNKEITKP